MQKMICSECGENLKVDYEKKIAVCPNCEAAFLLDDVCEDMKKQKKLQKIQELDELGEYEKAEKSFRKLIKKYPDDYELMWKFVNYLTNDLEITLGKYVIVGEDQLLEAEEYAHKAVELAPDDAEEEMCEAWERYVRHVNDIFEKEKKEKEEEKIRNLQKIINGDLVQLDGFYFGMFQRTSSYFFFEGGKLYLSALVKEGRYICEDILSDSLPREQKEVFLDAQGFLMFREEYGWIKKSVREGRVLMDGKEVQILGVGHYQYQSPCSTMSGFCTIKLGTQQKRIYSDK